MIYTTFDPTKLGADLALEQAGTVLTYTGTTDLHRAAFSTVAGTGGVMHAEFYLWGDASIANAVAIGVSKSRDVAKYVGEDAGSYGYRPAEGQVHSTGSSVAAVATAGKGQIIAVDVIATGSAVNVSWSVDGAPVHSLALPDDGPWYLGVTLRGSTGYDLRCLLNAGQRAFSHPRFAPAWVRRISAPPALHVADQGFISASTDAAPNIPFRGVMLPGARVNVRRAVSFWHWRRQGSTRAELSIANGDGHYDDLRLHDLRDAQVDLVDTDGSGWDGGTALGRFVADQVHVAEGEVRISMTGKVGQLGVPLQRRLVRPDADESSANQVWPVAFGAVRSIAPKLLDGADCRYAMHDGMPLGLGFVRTSGDKLDHVGAPPDYTLEPDGTLTLANPAAGPLTMDLSTVGGTVPGDTPVDLLSGDGDFSDATKWVTQGDFVTIDAPQHPNLTFYVPMGSSGVAWARHATWQADPAKLYRIDFDITSMSPVGEHSGDGRGNELLILPDNDGAPVSWFNAPTRMLTPGSKSVLYQALPGETGPFYFAMQRLNVDSNALVRVDNVKVYELDTTPVDDDNLLPITLADMLAELLEGRAGWESGEWSRADAEAIDTATGYAGMGYFADAPVMIADVLHAALDSYFASSYIDRAGVLRIVRLIAPESATSQGTLTPAGDVTLTLDTADGLSTTVAGRRNWRPLQASEIVTDTTPGTGVPLAERAMLGRKYRFAATWPGALPAALTHAIYADPHPTLLDRHADIQAEAEYIGQLYPTGTVRHIYTVPVDNVRRFEPGQVWTLQHPRFGLDTGLPVFVLSVIEDLIDNTGHLEVWG